MSSSPRTAKARVHRVRTFVAAGAAATFLAFWTTLVGVSPGSTATSTSSSPSTVLTTGTSAGSTSATADDDATPSTDHDDVAAATTGSDDLSGVTTSQS